MLWRVPILAALAFFSYRNGFHAVGAHTMVETPSMQYAMWADNHSLEPQQPGTHNLLGLRSPVMGMVAVAVAMIRRATGVPRYPGSVRAARRHAKNVPHYDKYFAVLGKSSR
jgi:hypothetical protein